MSCGITEVKKQFKDHNQVDEIVQGLTPLAEEWAARVERKMETACNLVGGPTSENVATLEQLCELGWAERGLRVKCTVCGRVTFVSLDAVAPRGKAIPAQRMKSQSSTDSTVLSTSPATRA
jgi:hypothetical protein